MKKFLIFLLLFMVIFSPSIRGCFCSEISQTFISNNFLPPSPSPNDGIAVVVTLDGTMHLVEQVSWKVLWSFSSGRPIYSSYQAFHDGDKDEFNASDPNSDLYVDCGDDLQLYVHSRRHGRLRKLGLSAEEYVRRTPYVAEDGAITLGVKKTTVYLVDAKSGRLVQTYRLEDPPTVIDVQNNAGKTVFWPKNAEALVESGPSNSTTVQQLVYIMRTDYVLQYYSPKSGEVLWNVAFANIDAELRCLGSENKLSVDYSYDSELQLPCKMKPVVFQIRDHKSLEFPPDNGWLRRIIPPPDSNPKHQLPPANDIVQSLPNIGWLDGLIPIPDRNQNSQLPPDDDISLPALPSDKQLLALPSSEMENPLMLDDSNMNVTTMFTEINRSSIQSLIAFFATVSIIIGLAFYCPKQGKGSKQDQEFRLQAASHKKKKPKRSANTKNSANNEKKKKLFAEENMVGNTNEIPYVEGDEGKSFLTFTNLVDGHVNGRRIGKLLVSNNEIAKGSNGTIVLEGIYDGRPVAVKRLVRSHHDVALQEIQMLIASDQHPNIVRWYGVEFDQDFVYLSLERCTCSLNDLIYVYSESFQNQTIVTDEDSNLANEYNVRLHTLMENINDIELWKPNGCPNPHLLKLMRDIVSGLAHLHELGIIHRDLKPQNVLIIKERSLCAKLSDMGISKRLTGDMSSLTRSATGYGSSGWQAPEQLRQERQTRAVDLFSLGCVLFFCITGGKNPYGDSIERDVNIVNDRKDLFLIESIPEAMDLFSFLLDPNPEMRPKAQDVLHHPLFWSPEMRLSFLRDASDRVELEDRKGESDVLNALESIAAVALDGKWDEKLETALIGDIGRYRRYKFDSVRDLLRVIRNKMNHYRELPGEIQELLGPVPEGFDDYFSKRFPKLLIEVYKVLYNYCKEEEFFQKYIKSCLI